MKVGAGFCAIALAASFCACDGRDPSVIPTAPTPTGEVPPPSLPARVQGLVLDFQTGRPLPGVVVGFSSSLSVSGVTETAVTDADGRYSLAEPPVRPMNQPYGFFVDNEYVGRGYPRATNYRADIAVDRGRCIARYGMVLDSGTFAPIVGATARSLSNQLRATTDRDGWYHMDWGCGVGQLGFNTRWDIMSHPDYNDATFAGGRGIGGNYREDVLMVRK